MENIEHENQACYNLWWVVRYGILMELLDESDLMSGGVNNKNEMLIMLQPITLIIQDYKD